MESENVYYYAFLTCVAVTLIYSALIYFCAGFLVWISIIGTGVGFGAIAFYLNMYRSKHYPSDKTISKNNLDVGMDLKIACYVLYGVVALYFVAICCLYKDIEVAVAVLRTSATIVMKNIRMLLLPLASGVCILLWACGWAAGFGYLLSCG